MVYLFGFIQLLGFQNYYNHKMQRCILRKRCFEKMQLINRRTPIPKCDFNKVASNFIIYILQNGCSPVNLLHMFRVPFPKKTSGGLLL